MAERARGAVVLELVERWRKASGRGLLYIPKSEREAEYLGANVHSLFPNCPVMVFPRWDCSPYDPAGPSRETMGRRASVLRRLAAPYAAGAVGDCDTGGSAPTGSTTLYLARCDADPASGRGDLARSSA